MEQSLRFPIRTWQNVSLGPLRIGIRSNEEQFRELHYFPENVRAANDAAVDYVVHCCNLKLDGPWSAQELDEARDRTYRGKRFAGGYYLTDHFGAPAYLATAGKELWIFAEEFEGILWPFVVKLLLTYYAADENYLHLKAACVSLDGSGTLLVGRGGSGKTVLLARLCQSGAKFLTNTHALIRDQTIEAMPTAMRVRNDPLFGAVITTGRLAAGIKPGEYLADPQSDLQWQTVDTARVRSICLVDYRDAGRSVVRDMDPEELFNYMEHFSLAVNIYGLREDVFDYMGADVERLSDYWTDTKMKLKTLIRNSRRYYVSCDAMDDRQLASLRNLLVQN